MHVLFRTVKVCIVIRKPLSVANSISPFFYIVSNKVTIYPSVVHILLEVIENAFQFKNSTFFSFEFFEYINCVFTFTLLMPVSKSSLKPCVCKNWKTIALHILSDRRLSKRLLSDWPFWKTFLGVLIFLVIFNFS